MALINCIECNNQISEYADSCPHCGCPMTVIQRLYRERREKQEKELQLKEEETRKKEEEISKKLKEAEIRRSKEIEEEEIRKKLVTERIAQRNERRQKNKEQGKCITWENIEDSLPAEGYSRDPKYAAYQSYYMAASFKPGLRAWYEEEYYVDSAITKFAIDGGFRVNKNEAKAPDTARYDFYRWLNRYDNECDYEFSIKDILFISKYCKISKENIYDDRIVATSYIGELVFSFKKPQEIVYKNAIKLKVKDEKKIIQILCYCECIGFKKKELNKIIEAGIDKFKPDVLIEMTDDNLIDQELRDVTDLTFLDFITWYKGTTKRQASQTKRTYTATSSEWGCEYTLTRIDYTDKSKKNDVRLYIKRGGHNVYWFRIDPNNELIDYIKENNIHEVITSEVESGIRGFGTKKDRNPRSSGSCIYCNTSISMGVVCDKCRDLYMKTRKSGGYPSYDPNAKGSNGYSFIQ